ncbi:MAG: hypothetical protein NTU97_00470, partial [Candidatus Magasanikbacteria bacterium]|nr:hypothetical protein [Candidatus Magasanikbacteria bacterium]
MEAFLNSRKIALNKLLGVGGEAEVYKVGNTAIKIFKPPAHPHFDGLPNEQEAARLRLLEQRSKLPAFPQGLPGRVIVPQGLVQDAQGNLIGYAMKIVAPTETLRRFSERSFRDKGVSQEEVRKIFLDIHSTVTGLHHSQIVIGDFNDLNILVQGTEAYFIDADSFQFGPYLCKVFTTRFVDPLLCDPQESSPVLFRPYGEGSDWYSFNVMAFQSLLLVDPYGGVYLPKNKTKKVPHDERPLKRITVFNPEVRYPKPAIPYGVLPDDLLEYFRRVFEKDLREEFPIDLLLQMRWTKCGVCGTEHSRAICPNCGKLNALPVKEKIVIKGKVICSTIFKTSGVILNAAWQDKRLLFVYNEKGEFKREDKTVLFGGNPDPSLRFRLSLRRTMVGQGGQMVTLALGEAPEKTAVEEYRGRANFDANSYSRYWTHNGALWRNGTLGQEHIGDTLSENTAFWVGEHFGLGIYQAGAFTTGFVFDAKGHGLNDKVSLTPIRGKLLGAKVYFSRHKAWLFTSVEEKGKTINRCEVVTDKGMVEGVAEAKSGDGTWLSTLRGKCAVGDFLLSASDDGIVRIENDSGRLVVAKEFP